MKSKQVNLIEVQDWDQLVESHYKRQYRFQQQDGCRSRGTYSLTVPSEAEDFENTEIPEIVNGDEMGVSFAAWLARDPQQPIPNQTQDYELRLFWCRNFYPNIEMIANDLHSKGLLEAGEYLINIDW